MGVNLQTGMGRDPYVKTMMNVFVRERMATPYLNFS